jgi:predicted ATPase
MFLAKCIEEMRQGGAAHQQTATSLLRPQFLGLLAEALWNVQRREEAFADVEEALRLAHRSGDGIYLAELHRIRGELLLRQGGSEREIQAAECFNRSIKIAQRQAAKFWELRTSISLAHLYQSQKKQKEAREILAPAFDWFTEGFETKDLQEAKSLLDELTSD